MVGQVVLVGSDGVEVSAPREAVMLSKSIAIFLEDAGDPEEEQRVPVPNLDGAMVRRVMDYCVKHSQTPALAPEELAAWDTSFVGDPAGKRQYIDLLEAAASPEEGQRKLLELLTSGGDQRLVGLLNAADTRGGKQVLVDIVKADGRRSLLELLKAANYLNVEDLVTLSVDTLNVHLRELVPSEIREVLSLPPLTDEQEAELLKVKPEWIFE